MSDSQIRIGINGSATYTGPDAVRLFQATVIKNALDLYDRTGMLANRAYTPANMLLTASRITGKAYKRGRKGRAAAIADLTVWCNAMASALPVAGWTSIDTTTEEEPA